MCYIQTCSWTNFSVLVSYFHVKTQICVYINVLTKTCKINHITNNVTVWNYTATKRPIIPQGMWTMTRDSTSTSNFGKSLLTLKSHTSCADDTHFALTLLSECDIFHTHHFPNIGSVPIFCWLAAIYLQMFLLFPSFTFSIPAMTVGNKPVIPSKLCTYFHRRRPWLMAEEKQELIYQHNEPQPVLL